MGEARVLEGRVVSDRMDKTVVVSVERHKTHRLYHKVMTLTTRYKAHDEHNECRLGDIVRIRESRPMSREKRWRVVEIVVRGDVAEVAPQTIGREIEQTEQIAPKSAAQLAGEEAETRRGDAAAPVGELGTPDEEESAS